MCILVVKLVIIFIIVINQILIVSDIGFLSHLFPSFLLTDEHGAWCYSQRSLATFLLVLFVLFFSFLFLPMHILIIIVYFNEFTKSSLPVVSFLLYAYHIEINTCYRKLISWGGRMPTIHVMVWCYVIYIILKLNLLINLVEDQ